MTALTPKTDQVRQALQERFPSGLLPYGSDAEIAREFDISRELVRQIKSSLGFKTGKRPKVSQPRYLCPCGKIRTTNSLCESCRLVTLPCHACGKTVSRSVREVLHTLTHPKSRGHIYCSRHCLGLVAGREFGFASEHGRQVLREQGRSYAQRSHCRNGHVLSPDNIYKGPRTHNGVIRRWCKVCLNARRERYRHGNTAGSLDQGGPVPAGPQD